MSQPKPRVQAPKKRSGPPTTGGRNNRNLLIALGVSLVVAAAIVVGVILSGGGSDSDPAAAVAAAMEDAGCTLQVENTPTDFSGDHSDVASPDQVMPQWNTDPATSGPHYVESAIWGRYSEPLEQARVVHNLEHGGVFIMYGDEVPEATVAQLSAFYDDHQNGTILAPLPRLGDEIAIGAWVTEGAESIDGAERGRGFLAKCTEFDEAAFSTYFDELQFKGPERFDPSQLRPGH